MSGLKKKAKLWIDANVWDGEDRSGCKKDSAIYNPDDLQELVDDLVEDLFEEQQNQITKLEKAVKAANHLIHSHEMTVFLGVHRELSQEALAELNPQQEE